LTAAKKKCFVIMPFSKTIEHHTEEYWKRHFDLYLKPLIERSNDLEAFRSQPLRGDIASQIITDLAHSEIVVADLTDHNPNVLWELGVRQSFSNCTITIAEVGTQIPFHFSHKGILFYNGEHLDNQEFEENVLNALRNCIESPNEPDSPVLAALGGRGTLYSLMHSEENRRKVKALLTEINHNEERIATISKDCERNKTIRAKKKSDKCLIPTVGLLNSTAEHLYVTRYLDLDETFYEFVQVYYSAILVINEHLKEWAYNPEYVEDYFIENKQLALDTIKGLRDILIALEQPTAPNLATT
jgi:hypothetical protein